MIKNLWNKSNFIPSILGCFLICLTNFSFFSYKQYGNIYGALTHTWSAGYYGNYIVNNFKIPNIINTVNATVGNVYPLFYGRYFYSISGLIGYFTNYDFSLKFMIFIFSFFLYYFFYKLTFKISNQKLFSVVMSTIIIFAVYPLTNYFSRNAFIEWFGNITIIIATLIWFLSLLETDKLLILYNKTLFTIFMTLGITGHAITTFYSSYIIFIIAILSFLMIMKKNNYINLKYHLITSSIFSLLTVIISLPWLYMCLKFMDKIYLGSTINHLQFYEGIDNLLVRISPFAKVYPENAGYPWSYITAQVITFLFIITIFMLIIILLNKIYKEYKLYILSACFLLTVSVFILLNTCILPNGKITALSAFFSKQQFAYRATNQINLCFIFAFLFLLFPYASIKQKFNKNFLSLPLLAIISISLAFSFLGVFIKTEQFKEAAIIRESKGKEVIDDYTKITSYFHGIHAYYVWPKYLQEGSFPKESTKVFFEVDNKKDYGKVYNKVVLLNKPLQVIIDVYPFPWNNIYINDVKYSVEDLSSNTVGSKTLDPRSANVFISLNPGTYTFRYSFEPSSEYIILEFVSNLLLGLIIAFVFILGLYTTLNKINTK